jgi:TolA-binding protein
MTNRKLAALVLAAGVAGSVQAQAPDQAEMQRLMEQARQMQQNMPALDAAQIQQMQARAQEMQACMENVDQAALEKLQQEGEAVGHEIKALCSAGKREQAQSRAMDYGRRIAGTPALAEMRKCGEMMQGMMAAMPMPNLPGQDGNGGASHVCDEID